MSRIAQFSALLADHAGAPAPNNAKALPLQSQLETASWARAIDELLPDGGLPRGAVVEVASLRGLARATSLALLACSAAQHEARLRSGDPLTVGAWCAFVDPWSTLNVAALIANHVDPTRLLVVRPPLDALARVVVRIAESHAFSLVVVDTVGVPGAALAAAFASQGLARKASGVGAPRAASWGGDWRQPPSRLATRSCLAVPKVVRLERWSTVVRRLAIAVERTDTTIVLLTDSAAQRALPLPVSLRLELVRRIKAGSDEWSVRVAKERYGRVGAAIAVAS